MKGHTALELSRGTWDKKPQCTLHILHSQLSSHRPSVWTHLEKRCPKAVKLAVSQLKISLGKQEFQMAIQVSDTVHRRQKTVEAQFMFSGLYSNYSVLAGFLRKQHGFDYTVWSSVCDSYCTNHFFLTQWPICRHLSLEDDCILIAVVRIGIWIRREIKMSVATEIKTGKTQLLWILLGTVWLSSTHVNLVSSVVCQTFVPLGYYRGQRAPIFRKPSFIPSCCGSKPTCFKSQRKILPHSNMKVAQEQGAMLCL